MLLRRQAAPLQLRQRSHTRLLHQCWFTLGFTLLLLLLLHASNSAAAACRMCARLSRSGGALTAASPSWRPTSPRGPGVQRALPSPMVLTLCSTTSSSDRSFADARCCAHAHASNNLPLLLPPLCSVLEAAIGPADAVICTTGFSGLNPFGSGSAGAVDEQARCRAVLLPSPSVSAAAA